MIYQVYIIGGGFVGSEVVWQFVWCGICVWFLEMWGIGECLFVYQIDVFVELVCLNSFCFDDDEKNVVGLLYYEMCCCDLLIMGVVVKV